MPILQDIFGTQALTAAELAIAFLASSGVFVISELWKWWLRRRGE